ncbi:Gas vesicle synthesis GvpLGvpF [Psychromonas ingrahamii 37]|uniref:Gas vesicle synthesis GvpLGvpF n=1 Tax=Psychromonas ingrahamii (strain DSM 17664 / CCUG 51855 / 37) TaxID=357804 RepID=A1SUB3_PSYIN|nr:GvpL/GvpF family gas vesicle protein [Psychromonas ingrahamii]ABM03078.1 Gas vesicle synthesis GvpLGvpF [Psychromonas ingrahamii 37]
MKNSNHSGLDPNQALYLYCFVHADSIQSVTSQAIEKDSPVFIYQWQDIAAVLSHVPTSYFTGYDDEEPEQTIARILPRTQLHEQVIEEVMRQSPVFPAQFGTLFSSQESLEQEISQQYLAITHTLKEVSGSVEWAVKGVLDRGVAEKALYSQQLTEQQNSLSSSPGMRHLQEQRLRRETQSKLNSWLHQLYTDIATPLSELSGDFFQRKIPSSIEEGKEVILNWAFLVPESAGDDFHAQIDKLNQRLNSFGLVIQCSGPWPPYSFCNQSS